MAPTLLAIIAGLLIFIAYIEWRHERFVERITQPPRLPRLPPPIPRLVLPRPLSASELLGPSAGQQSAGAYRHMPFLLERPVGPAFWEVAPTRPWVRFENYGVDISVHPIVGIS